MKVVNLEFEEPVTGFIAYTLETPGTQSFTFMRPDSEFIRVVLPEGYVTGNRVFGIARPEPLTQVLMRKEGRLFCGSLPKWEIVRKLFRLNTIPSLHLCISSLQL